MPETIKKILYIEPDASSRVRVRGILEQPGIAFFEAAKSCSGLSLAGEIIPDLILVGFQAPDLSWLELAGQIKSRPGLRNTLVVALAGADAPQARQASLAAGYDGFIPQPGDARQFHRRILEFLSGAPKKPEGVSRETVDQSRIESLPEQLRCEIELLQKTNRLLSGRAGKLQEYSRKLETLHQVSIRLQNCNSPRALRSKLIEEICGTLRFDRCAFLEVDSQALRLTVSETYGFEPGKWENLSIRYPAAAFQNLFQNSALLFFVSPEKIPDSQTRQILQQIHARRFLFGLLGAPAPVNIQLAGEENFRELLANLIPDLYGGIRTGLEQLQELLREYLSLDIFYVGGYLFMDYKAPEKRFTRYDIKILEMLLRTAGMLYQNLQMREQLKAFFIRAEKDALTDHLTGLFNYRYFIQELHREFDRARRHGSQFVLLMLDVDYFKFYNDAFGHPAGDLVLKKLAKLLQKNTRSSDTVARYGGEEFMVICPELGKEGGKKIAEKLCRMVATAPFPKEAEFSHQKITISIGVAAYPADAVSPEELVRHVDIALYEAKQGGRNRVLLYQGEV